MSRSQESFVWKMISDSGDVRQPFNDMGCTLEVTASCEMRNTVLVHDLSASELQVRRVDLHFAPQHLVQSAVARQNDRLAVDRDGTLAKTDGVCADTHRPVTSVIAKISS